MLISYDKNRKKKIEIMLNFRVNRKKNNRVREVPHPVKLSCHLIGDHDSAVIGVDSADAMGIADDNVTEPAVFLKLLL